MYRLRLIVLLVLTAVISGLFCETEKIKPKLTFLEFGSTTCVPCKKMEPILDEVKEKYSDQVSVVFHNVKLKETREIAGKYKIRLIPTQVFLDQDGKEVYRHEGFLPLDKVLEVLKENGIDLEDQQAESK